MSLTWQEALANTLLHFLWQGGLVALVVAGAFRYLASRPPRQRYVVGLMGLLAMVVFPLATLVKLSPPLPTRSAFVMPLDRVAEVSDYHGPSSPAVRAMPPARSAPIMPDTINETHYGWVVAAWSVGVFLSSVRLLVGHIAFRRWSWPRLPLPPELTAVVQRLAQSASMRVPCVFLNPRVPEALALGILRTRAKISYRGL